MQSESPEMAVYQDSKRKTRVPPFSSGLSTYIPNPQIQSHQIVTPQVQDMMNQNLQNYHFLNNTEVPDYLKADDL